MYCPKCGLQNGDATKFCRGCGSDLGNVLAVVEGKPAENLALAEKQIDLFSSGIRGLMIGLGFLIVSGISFGISVRLAVLGIFALAFASFFVGTGIARLVQARALRRLREESSPPPALASGETEYIKPVRSIYDTDELNAIPGSITERTTTHLKKR